MPKDKRPTTPPGSEEKVITFPAPETDTAFIASAINVPTEEAPSTLADIARWTMVVYLIVGAGRRGKSVLARYIIEKASENGIRLKVVDLEGVNPGLRESHPECVAPNFEIHDGQALSEFLYPYIADVPVSGRSMLVDFEGNDERVIQLCRESDLLAVLEALGVRLVIVCVTGGATDDQALMKQLCEHLGTRPSVPTALCAVVADRLLPASKKAAGRMERELLDTEGVGALLDLPASSCVIMPTCEPIAQLDNVAITYREASTLKHNPDNPLSLWDRTIVATWLRRLDLRLKHLVPRK